jgi:hypothetical protein
MPALPDASQIVRVSYNGTYGGAKWANVFHVRYSPGPPTQADMNSLATGLAAAWTSALAPLHSATVSMSGTTVVDLSSNVGLVGTDATLRAGTASTTTNLPANVALVGSFKIARRYRGGHPRMYLTGQLGANTTNTTTWIPAWVTSTSNGFTSWRTAINALTYTSMPTINLVNLSYYSHGALRGTPVWDYVSSIVVHNRVDTMRRRLGKEIS